MIRGNSAVLKCSIPSFVADFVNVVAWSDSEGNKYPMDTHNYGIFNHSVVVQIPSYINFVASVWCETLLSSLKGRKGQRILNNSETKYIGEVFNN